MTELYKVFVEKRYPEGWDPAYKKRAHDSLGLFLAQYLCNGFNLADAGRLTYNRTYFAEGGRAFEFMRKKTYIGTKQQHVGGYRSYHRTTQSDP